MANETCGNCRFFIRWPDSRPPIPNAYLDAFDEEEEPGERRLGDCRRYAPGPIGDLVEDSNEPRKVVIWHWPVVSVRHWCGEHEKAKPE
jgi:hypothetical protein